MMNMNEVEKGHLRTRQNSSEIGWMDGWMYGWVRQQKKYDILQANAYIGIHGFLQVLNQL